MKKGIFTVGFPDTKLLKEISQDLLDDIRCDADEIRSLIAKSDNPVMI